MLTSALKDGYWRKNVSVHQFIGQMTALEGGMWASWDRIIWDKGWDIALFIFSSVFEEGEILWDISEILWDLSLDK